VSTSRNLARLAPLLVGLLGVSQIAAQCGRPAEATGCQRDGDCQNFQLCEIETGICLCAEDNACDAEEFCNLEGFCQPKLGCTANKDCRSDDRPQDICDTTIGECVTLGATKQCALDSHCPFGSYCDGAACIPGCRDNGDCALGDPCLGGQCDPTPGACNADGFCEFGESCNQVTTSCVAHADKALLCQSCQPQYSLLDPVPCDGNSCLIDTSIPPQSCSQDAQCSTLPGTNCLKNPCLENTDCPGGAVCEGASFFAPGECSTGFCRKFFCGSDSCDPDTNPCPRGYQCSTLITVSGAPCTNNTQCAQGSACLIGGENENQGFCSCVSNDDCPNDPLSGVVSECQNPGPNGICVTGTTCGPTDGLLCEDLL
jgi:hypothetical protein